MENCPHVGQHYSIAIPITPDYIMGSQCEPSNPAHVSDGPPKVKISDEDRLSCRCGVNDKAAVLPFPNELSQMKKHECTCKRCKVHGVSVKLKGHKKDCPRQHCKCPGCSLVVAYREEHARDQFQLRQSESSDGEPATLSAAEKQVARGVRNRDLYEKLNKSMEEYARESPGIHPMLYMRKAISQIQSSQFIISYVNSIHNAKSSLQRASLTQHPIRESSSQ
ncbi:hypothetical protein Bbelb_051680 [Branchiostoma belcheri]|nr:hypothetical protein Bbelb_051680 [Branchiostoma belcheri]